MVVDCVEPALRAGPATSIREWKLIARLKTLIAGAAGMVLAFGIAALVHGLYELVPSVFVALS